MLCHIELGIDVITLNNLVTLCETCHKAYHKGLLRLPADIKRGTAFRNAAFMGIMRWKLYDVLKETHQNVSMTFGYITKYVRIMHGLPKGHFVDARCISGTPDAVSDGDVYYFKKIRRHNRQLYKFNASKGSIKKRNQAEHMVHGFCLFDSVMYQGKPYFVFGRRKTGYFDIRDLSGGKVNKGSVSWKKLRMLEHCKGYIVERRSCFPLMTEVTSLQTA